MVAIMCPANLAKNAAVFKSPFQPFVAGRINPTYHLP